MTYVRLLHMVVNNNASATVECWETVRTDSI